MFFHLGLFVFLVGVSCLFIYYYHYLVCLMSIELMLLSVLFVVSFFCLDMYTGVMFFSFLLLLVCMGGFSISLLVSSSRGLGGDYFFLYFFY